MIGTFHPGPANASVNEGTIVLFECNYTAGDFIPTWIINDVPYQLTGLPKRHWVNASGLVVLATTDGDVNTTMTYQCRIDIFISTGGVFTDTSEVAILTVFNTGESTDAVWYSVCAEHGLICWYSRH